MRGRSVPSRDPGGGAASDPAGERDPAPAPAPAPASDPGPDPGPDCRAEPAPAVADDRDLDPAAAAEAGGDGTRSPQPAAAAADGGESGWVSAEDARTGLFAGVSCASAEAVALGEALLGLLAAGQDIDGSPGLGAAAAVADDVVLLARARHLLDAETARRAATADRLDAAPVGVATALRAAGWTAGAAAGLLRAGRFAERHPELHALWRAGRTSATAVAVISRGTTDLTVGEAKAVVEWLLPFLPRLDVPRVRVAVQAAVDRLRPRDADAAERDAYDSRYLAHSVYGGMVLLEARLPALEGEAFLAAIRAFAAKLRVAGDTTTPRQRNADALAALVAAAVAAGRVPSSGGLPAAATVTVSLSEAERVARGRKPRAGAELPDPQALFPPKDRATPSPAAGAGGPLDGRCGDSERGGGSWVELPGRIGGGFTLGDAAARFVLCCAPLTGVLADTPGAGSAVAALLGAAPLEPLAVGRTRRFATTHQRTALAVRDQGCVIPGCGIPPDQCQPHHVTDWADGGATDLERLALLCWTHHRQVDLHRWRLVRNPDTGGPHWTITPTKRSAWRPRR